MIKENELNFQDKESDNSDFVEQEEKVTASITDSAHVQTVNPVTEGGGFQQEVNENITQSINSIVSGSTKIKTITSSINTINSTSEGGTTQQQVNEKNKQNIDNLNDEFSDIVNGNTLIQTITSSIETVNSTSEGGTTQKQVNEKNKQNIDDLNDSIIVIDDKIDNLDFDINTSKVSATNSSLENGTTQQEINVKNKVNFDSLNSDISDINDKMESFGEANTTYSIKAVDTTLEGGINQKEINQVNKKDIDSINTLINDINSKIDDNDLKTNTENVSTVDSFFEGGPNQKEVNEANKKSIITLDSEIIKVNSEISDINEKIDCMECGCDSSGCDCDDITTSNINTTDVTAEGGSTQEIVNKNNKEAIDNLNNEVDTLNTEINILNEEVDDLINNGIPVEGDTAVINTNSPSAEGGSTQEIVNKNNKVAIDNLNNEVDTLNTEINILNEEVDDLINNGIPVEGDTAVINTNSPTTEGGSTQKEVNEANKEAIDNLNDEVDTLNTEIENIIDNGVTPGDTSTIDTNSPTTEGGSTQKEINEANKEAIDNLNDEVDTLNTEIENIIDNGVTPGDTSTIDTSNHTAEGGSTQKEVNEANKEAINNLNTEVDNIINGDTSDVPTADPAAEGGSTQKEVNEANKEAIDNLNDEVNTLNTEVENIIDNGVTPGDTSTIDTNNPTTEGGSTQKEVNEANKEAIDNLNDEVDTLNTEVENIIDNGVTSGDTSTIDTNSPTTEGGSTQKEINEANKEAIDNLNDEVDTLNTEIENIIDNGVTPGDTSTIDTNSPTTEGGSTQKEVNEANKEAIDNLNNEVDDIRNGDTSDFPTSNSAAEGGATQEIVNKNNKIAIDNLNNEVDNIIDGDTSDVPTADPAAEGGSTQKEVNESNKEAINNLNTEVDNIINGDTSDVPTADPTAEGGETQQEVNEANKEAIEDINDQLDDLSSPDTSDVPTVNPTAEGGETQQEVNEANKEAIDNLNDEVDDLINNGIPVEGDTAVINTNSPSTEGGTTQQEVNEANKEAIDDINDQLDDLSSPDTSGVPTVDPTAEGGATQKEVNEANKEAIDNLNDEVDDLINNGIPVEGDTAVINTNSPSTEGGSTQKEVNEANKEAIDNLNDEVEDILNNGVTAGNTSTIDTTNPELEGGENQEEVNETNKEEIDEINEAIGNIWADLKSLSNCTDCPVTISSAVITNVVTIDNTVVDGSEGSITFDVNISNFLKQGTVNLNPAENTSPINLNKGDNIGLVFASLPAGEYSIEVYDGTILAKSENNVIILEPSVEISNENIIDGMGDGADTGSASATIDINGYDCALTAVITPDPNNVNPTSLIEGSNDVIYTDLPPDDYVVNIKCDDDIIKTFNFTIHDGAIIPDNDGFDDVVIPDNVPSLDDGTANYNFSNYQLLLIKIFFKSNGPVYYSGISIGTDYVFENLSYILSNESNTNASNSSYLELVPKNEKDYSINKIGSFPYEGIDFIKGYKKEITPLLNNEVNATKDKTVNLDIPITQFTHFITKTKYDGTKIFYSIASTQNFQNGNNFYIEHFAESGCIHLHFKNNSTFTVESIKNGTNIFFINMLWGVNFGDLKNLTNKIFNPHYYSILIVSFSIINSSLVKNAISIIYASDIISDGVTKYFITREITTDPYIIFNEDGSYKTYTPDISVKRINKIEGLILPVITKAYISNLIINNTSIINGNDGSIKFDVNISAFKGQGIAVLYPARDTLPINLNDGDNIGLIFDNLITGVYRISIMDDDNLIIERNNILILEPEVFASNTVVIDSMGDDVATGSVSTIVKTIGFNSGTAIINPNPNNVNPVPLNTGSNEVIFDSLSPDDYNLEIKNEDNIIKRFAFKINNEPIIPLNDGLNDLDISEDKPNLIGGITQDNLTDYELIFVNTLVNNSKYGTTLLLGTNLKINEKNYNLGHEWTALEIAKKSQQFLTFKLNAKNNYSLDSAGDVYNGINFIKGYKKEVTPLLSSELSLKKGEIANLDTSLDKFNYIITKSTFNDKFIEYILTSVKDLSLYKNKYWAGYGRTDNLYVNILDNNTKILVWSDGNSNNSVNMLWGVNFDNLDDLTNKVFNPKVYTLLLVHFNLNNSAYIGLVYTANIIADGKTKYYLTIINVLTYIIFNEDGTYTLGDIHNFTKIEGVRLDVIAKANIKNLIINDVTVNAGNDGSITFDVNISAFKGKGTAILNPAGDTLPIDLNDGDNVGLSFDNLIAGPYKIEIYDDENIVTKREDIIISEPIILLKNK